MRISLDYDDTYTRDPDLWNAFIHTALSRGHEVFCISFRFERQMDEPRRTVGAIIGPDNCFGTGHVSKRKFADDNNLLIDVWVDDMPEFIVDPIDTRFYKKPE